MVNIQTAADLPTSGALPSGQRAGRCGFNIERGASNTDRGSNSQVRVAVEAGPIRTMQMEAIAF